VEQCSCSAKDICVSVLAGDMRYIAWLKGNNWAVRSNWCTSTNRKA
jgi:hypothetical protein